MNIRDKKLLIQHGYGLYIYTISEIDDIYSKDNEADISFLLPKNGLFFEEVKIRNRNHFFQYIDELQLELNKGNNDGR